MTFNDFIVYSGGDDEVMEWCSFFYDAIANRVICVPDSQFESFMNSAEFNKGNVTNLLGNNPYIRVVGDYSKEYSLDHDDCVVVTFQNKGKTVLFGGKDVFED